MNVDISVPESEPREFPERLGRYRLIRRISRGGMAQVYEARRESLAGVAPRVALKVILPEHALDENFRHLFINEAQVGSQLQHPNLVQIQDFDQQEDLFYLVMEYVERGPGKPSSQRQLGENLARLHEVRKSFFGWNRDNAIGSTHQPNDPSDDWSTFYRERRLRFQFDLAAQRGKCFQGSEELLECVPDLLADHEVFPPLLHGDLWGGNADCDAKGEPFVFDPATYYGDRETDLAFTEMFGGFSTDFRKAYEGIFPLDVGYSQRKILYNLYHLLNHFNIFGGGYASSAQRSIDELL